MPGEHPLALHCNDIDRHTDNFLSPGAFFFGIEVRCTVIVRKIVGRLEDYFGYGVAFSYDVDAV